MMRMALMSRNSVLKSALLLVALVASSVAAQTPGVDVFICSPTSMTLTLNFTAGCPGTIADGPGITGTDCFTIPERNTSESFTPVSVSQFQVIEVNIDLTPAGVKNYVGDFQDGDSFEWASISAAKVSNSSQVPGGIQFVVMGIDEKGASFRTTSLIDYTNDGNTSPIFEIGEYIGWIVIVSVPHSFTSVDENESH